MAKKPKWTDVKAKLATFDRAGLTAHVQDLYAASEENQTFLPTRFELGEDLLEPYKVTIQRWIAPEITRRNADVSIAKAKQVISSYRKAVGEGTGLLELTVFYCEEAAGFSMQFGYSDGPYLNALTQMFEPAR